MYQQILFDFFLQILSPTNQTVMQHKLINCKILCQITCVV